MLFCPFSGYRPASPELILTMSGPTHQSAIQSLVQDRSSYRFKMSQPKFPRKFKFVGGPSRRRRRHAAPPRQGEPASNNIQRSMQSVSVLHPGSNPTTGSERNKDFATSTLTSRNSSGAIPAAASVADEAQVPSATVQPHPTDVVESLLYWPSSDTFESSLDMNDPLSLFGAPFHLATDPGLVFSSGAAPEHSLDNAEEDSQGDQLPSIVEDFLRENQLHFTEDISKNTSHELDYHRPIPGNSTDSFCRLFAQCKQL